MLSSDSPLSSGLDSDELDVPIEESRPVRKKRAVKSDKVKSAVAVSPLRSTRKRAAAQEEPIESASSVSKRTRTTRSGAGVAVVKDEIASASPKTSRRQSGRPPRVKKEEQLQTASLSLEVEQEVEQEVEEELTTGVGPENGTTIIKTAKKRSQVKAKVEISEEELDETESDAPKKNKRKRKTKKEVLEDEEDEVDSDAPKKVKRKRKTKEEKEAEAMPLAARTAGLRMYIGAHVSSAKGVHNSITNSVHIGGNALALFLKSQRKWANPALDPEHATLFRSACKDHKYDASSHVMPHGSYLVNLAQPEPEKATQAYDCFVDDLKRCEALGIRLYNFHPGTTLGHPREEGISRIAAALNRAHGETKSVTTVLETMAGGNNVIGATFEDLRDIIAQVDDKSRVGVCLDTCHVFAAGYDLRDPSDFRETMTRFDTTIGLRYLSALHLNDSKAPFSSRRDLHQNIGLGFLGLRAFHNIMNDQRLEGLPMVLETPIDRDGKEDKGIWAEEIKLLEGLIGMDPSSAEFVKKEKELADRGKAERVKLQASYDKKVEKEQKAADRQRKKVEGGGGGGTPEKKKKRTRKAKKEDTPTDDSE
ncbi:MAG: hypothetical protein M1823_001965 [Watsoniomyces obsoletus]|nr:MAG: hypothetical protein M1823_001965 [Watsoniomyces obsoletus]